MLPILRSILHGSVMSVVCGILFIVQRLVYVTTHGTICNMVRFTVYIGKCTMNIVNVSMYTDI